MYSINYPVEKSETGIRLDEQIYKYRGYDYNSHVYEHSVNSNHGLETLDDFTVFTKTIDLTLTNEKRQFP